MKEWKKKLFRKMLWKNIFYNTDYWEKKYCNELNIFLFQICRYLFAIVFW